MPAKAGIPADQDEAEQPERKPSRRGQRFARISQGFARIAKTMMGRGISLSPPLAGLSREADHAREASGT